MTSFLQTTRMVLLGAFLFFAPAVSQADIIYSDIAANPFGTGYALLGAGVSVLHSGNGLGGDFGQYAAWASAFTAPADSVVSEIDLVLNPFNGYGCPCPQTVTVNLYSNTDVNSNVGIGSIPGLLLASENLTFPSAPSAPEQLFFSGVALTQGETYWVGVLPQDSGASAYYWGANYTEFNQLSFYTYVGSTLTWFPEDGIYLQPEFAVIGSVSPEPSCWGLLCVGMAMLLTVNLGGRRMIKGTGNQCRNLGTLGGPNSNVALQGEG
jgi:hypothetical protein